MIKLKKLITEIQWEEWVLGKIYNRSIPMTPKMINRIFGTMRIRAAHISNFDNFKKLYKLQGSKKGISMFTAFRDMFLRKGVWSGIGIVSIVEGDILIGKNMDIMSTPDKQGRRWINLFHLDPGSEFTKLSAKIDNLKDDIYMDVVKQFDLTDKYDYVKLDGILKAKELYRADWNEDDPDFKITGKDFDNVKGYIIREYMTGIEKLLMKNKNVIEAFRDAAIGTKNDYVQYNEVLVNNFKIIEAFVDTGYPAGKITKKKMKQFNSGIKMHSESELTDYGKSIRKSLAKKVK